MRIVHIVWAALREIFDESAYQRFLAAHGRENSPSAYREFLRERQSAAERRFKCC